MLRPGPYRSSTPPTSCARIKAVRAVYAGLAHADIIVAICAVAVVAFLAGLVFLQGCQLHHPVPCPTDAVYPDPCAYEITETVSDAGRDAR